MKYEEPITNMDYEEFEKRLAPGWISVRTFNEPGKAVEFYREYLLISGVVLGVWFNTSNKVMMVFNIAANPWYGKRSPIPTRHGLY